MWFAIKMLLLGLGAVFLLLILFVVIAYWYLKKKIQGIIGDPEGEMGLAPLTLDLYESEDSSALDAPAAIEHRQAFEALGFTTGKIYAMNMPGLEMLTFFNPPYTGVVYWINGEVFAYDIAFISEDHHGVTVTTQKYSGTPKDPRTKLINLRGATVAEAFEKVQAEVAENYADKQVLALNDDNFVEHITASHRRDIVYMCNLGGMPRERFMVQAREEAPDVEQSELDERFYTLKVAELHQWHNYALEEFLSSAGDNDENEDDTYLIAPPMVDLNAYLAYLRDRDFIRNLEIDQFEKLYNWTQDASVIIEGINPTRPGDTYAEPAGTVSFPFEGKIYRVRNT